METDVQDTGVMAQTRQQLLRPIRTAEVAGDVTCR